MNYSYPMFRDESLHIDNPDVVNQTNEDWRDNVGIFENKQPQKQTTVLNIYNRECLVYGYGKQYCTKAIPMDILTICLSMFGFDGFSYRIKANDLLHLTAGNHLMSDIFTSNHTVFQIVIKRDEPTTHNGGFNFSYNSDILKVHLNIMDPKLQYKKVARIILLLSLYSKQINMKVNAIINTSFDFSTKQCITHQINGAFFDQNDIKLNANELVEFNGNIDVLHIDYLDNMHNLIIYHPIIRISQYIEYEWNLMNSMESYVGTDKESYIGSSKLYFSPVFGDGNWQIIFVEYAQQMEVTLQLMSLPVNIGTIYVQWKCALHYNGITQINARTSQFCVTDTAYQQTSDRWKKMDFGLNDKDGIDDVSIKLYIDIFKAEELVYTALKGVYYVDKYDNTSTFNWSFGSYSDPRILCNQEMNAFGIVSNDRENVMDRTHFVLHKTVGNVKIGTVHNDDSCPLYIDKENEWKSDIEREEKKEEVMDAMNVFSDADIELSFGGNYLTENKEDFDDNKEEIVLFDYDGNNDEKQNVMNDENGYKWIKKTLRDINANNYDDILNGFKVHQVTDKRLCGLKDNDWRELIKPIGIRNEIKDLFELKRSEDGVNDDYKVDHDNENINQVRTWLNSIGFKIYFDQFIKNGFDSMDIIKEIKTQKHLKSLGVDLIAHQIKIMNGIGKLND